MEGIVKKQRDRRIKEKLVAVYREQDEIEEKEGGKKPLLVLFTNS